MSLSESGVAPGVRVLDPRTLGRPVHLLPAFAARFGADVAESLRLGPNRRYGTGLFVEDSAMSQRGQDAAPVRWNVYAGSLGRIGLALPRPLVLRLLQCRYGLQPAAEPAAPGAVEITASEERLSHKLGLQLALALARRIEEGLPPPGVAATPQAAAAEPALAFHGESALPTGLWQLDLQLAEESQSASHHLRFSLDERCMHHLLDRLGRGRALPRAAAPATQPLAARLKLRLVVRLVHQRLPLGAILDLQPGSVLPIPQPSAVALVKDSPLFEASVAEHKGRLWLTGFQDL